jgi:hypothetical protein
MKSAASKQTLDDIADFIRTEYSQDGVEIGAQGARSITVKLPEELALTELCADLWNEFNAPVELKSGTTPGEPILTVWAPDDHGGAHSARPLSSSARSTSRGTCFGGVSLTQAVAVAVVQALFLGLLNNTTIWASDGTNNSMWHLLFNTSK